MGFVKLFISLFIFKSHSFLPKVGFHLLSPTQPTDHLQRYGEAPTSPLRHRLILCFCATHLLYGSTHLVPVHPIVCHLRETKDHVLSAHDRLLKVQPSVDD